jgi:hypothetical protein
MSNSDDRLDRMLHELGPVDPPVDFRRRVMVRIATLPKPAARVVRFGRRRDNDMTRKAMWGLAAAAAIVLAVFAVTGFPSVGRGIEGTIGAAKKYQTPQMGNADVILGDAAAQEFLQSDAFDRLMKDPEARALLSDAEVRNGLRNKAIADAIANPEVRPVLASDQLKQLFADAENRAALEDAYRNKAVAAVKQATAETAVKAYARTAVARARGDQQLKQVLDNEALVRALLDSNLYARLAKTGMVSRLSNDVLGRAAMSRGFVSALATARMADALAQR